MGKPVLLCIGHRGAMGHEPENTLRSICKAIELGAPCVEIDVYCVDGHLVVFHDERLERTTNGTGLVMEQSYDYLRSLDAGKGERIPALAEVCELLDGRAGLNIELKGAHTAAPVAETVSSMVETGWDKDAILVSSYDHQALFNMRQLDSDIQLGLITRMVMPGDLDLAESLGAFSIHPAHQYINPTFVKDAQVRGIKVYAYTVNQPDEISRMHEMGVDGVFTNYPERVLERYAQRGTGLWIG